MPARSRKIPTPQLKNIKLPFPVNTVSILVILLVVASFLIGVLLTKVSYLEKGTGTTTANVTAGEEGQPAAPTGPIDVAVGHLPPLGNESAKVKIVEFSDFQCPFCKSLFEETFPQIKKDYIDTGKAVFYYRHYPLSSIHPNAQKAAEAAECANEQGNFWGYHDELFEKQADWEGLSSDKAVEKFGELATGIGLNGSTLQTCVDSGKYTDKVKEDETDGNTAGVQGTPATFINGMLISGAAPYEDFKAEIENQLAN